MIALRYKVVGFTLLLAALTYFDRVCISTLAPSMMRELGLTPMQMSYVFSAFTIAYAAFEVPTAWWGERVGTRRVLARIVAWWSLFTMATGAVRSYAALLAVRFLFGAGEAGAWPNVARTFASWIPLRERGIIQGIFFAGAHLAGGVTPLLVLWLEPLLGWRMVFVVFGSLGFLWAAAWYLWFRDEPAVHPSITPRELELILAGRRPEGKHTSGWRFWRRALANRSVVALCVAYVSNSYGFYFLITWLPTYLEQQRGFSKASLGLFAGLPLMLSVFADIFGGITTDWLTRRFGLRLGRAGIGVCAYLVSGLAMLLAPGATNPVAAALLIATAAASSMFTLAASWATCIDIGGSHSGVISAAMNTSGQIAGVLSPVVLTLLVENFASWSLPLYVMAGLYLLSSAAWWWIDPRRPVFD
ncbi:MAG: MFS transporter [Bryobacteraceae bacterium]|nr:MFS transporter [Bryobacteraceae bacterium]MDW8376531.1 MFS transporter [Bryobacterales bacterium]